MSPTEEWVARLGEVPLAHQPGEGWTYNVGSDILGVLLARGAGMSLGELLTETIFEPLGMRDTGFWTDERPGWPRSTNVATPGSSRWIRRTGGAPRSRRSSRGPAGYVIPSTGTVVVWPGQVELTGPDDMTAMSEVLTYAVSVGD